MQGVNQIQSDFRGRYEEYRNDVVIQRHVEVINRILLMATPRITIDFHSGERNMDIDKESKDKIAVWQQELNNYIENNYSDILCRQGKIEEQP